MKNTTTKPKYKEYENLNESCITPVDNTITCVSTVVPSIEVVSPASLPEGYTFDAQMGETTLSVTVPKGGIEEGQKFSVPFPDGTASGNAFYNRINVPVGHWKDEICSVCRHGCCHPMYCNALCCPLIGNAQVMTRLKLNWNAKPGNEIETQKTFLLVLYIVITFFILDFILVHLETSLSFTPGASVAAGIRNIIKLAYLVYQVYSIMMTRKYLRSKYAIPTMYCSENTEDLCCALCCSFCTVAQMGRHTTDYDTYHSACCSKTGLPDHIPAIL